MPCSTPPPSSRTAAGASSRARAAPKPSADRSTSPSTTLSRTERHRRPMVSLRAHRLPARAPAAILTLVLLPAAAFAQANAGDQAPADVTLPTIEVIGV